MFAFAAEIAAQLRPAQAHIDHRLLATGPNDIDRKDLVTFAHDWKAKVANPRLAEYPSRTQKIHVAAEEAAFDDFSQYFETTARFVVGNLYCN